MTASLVGGVAADLAQRGRALVPGNALLRQHLIILNRPVERPALTATERGPLVLLAKRLHTWASALVMVEPDTVLRRHRQGVRLLWRRTSRPASQAPRIPTGTVGLIRQMAMENRPWGAERIRGEVLQLGTRVSRRTVQRYTRRVRPPREAGQARATVVGTHASEIRARAFPRVTDLLFRPPFAFCIVELGSRRAVHVGVTRRPTGAWATQQPRGATPRDERPRFLIRDYGGRYGSGFDRLAAMAGIEVPRAPVRAPRANAILERVPGSARRGCPDHRLVLAATHPRHVPGRCGMSFDGQRPHQGPARRPPRPPDPLEQPDDARGRIVAVPIRGGVHHTCRRAA